jgi:hypothetical protein
VRSETSCSCKIIAEQRRGKEGERILLLLALHFQVEAIFIPGFTIFNHGSMQIHAH